MPDQDPLPSITITRCPCRRQVPLDYRGRDWAQTKAVLWLIDRRGEYLPVRAGGRVWRVSRHCIALHGIAAAQIESYGFEEITDATTASSS